MIRHYIQRKTTIDKIHVIDFLDQNDCYDLIFVVIQCIQLPSVVLSALANNTSQRIIFVGNNGDAFKTMEMLQNMSSIKKEVAFAFQETGGRKENGQIISIYKSLSLTIGGLNQPLSKSFQKMIDDTFVSTSYQLTYQHHMDAWLKCHLAFILPICYVCYSVDGQLPKATHKQRKAILDATYEGYQVLKKCGYPICPEGDDLYFQPGVKRLLMALMIFVMCKTPLGHLAASDHAMHAISEMHLLDKQFDVLCKQASIDMPNWHSLKNEMVNWQISLEKKTMIYVLIESFIACLIFTVVFITSKKNNPVSGLHNLPLKIQERVLLQSQYQHMKILSTKQRIVKNTSFNHCSFYLFYFSFINWSFNNSRWFSLCFYDVGYC